MVKLQLKVVVLVVDGFWRTVFCSHWLPRLLRSETGKRNGNGLERKSVTW